MRRLNQIIAIRKGDKQRLYSELDVLYKAAQKAERLNGYDKTYQPRAEDGEVFPPESKVVELSAERVLEEIRANRTVVWDNEITLDAGNRAARASLIVDGIVLVVDVPATTLLHLEKELTDMRTFVTNIPVLDPGKVWTLDANTGMYRAAPVVTTKTKKIEVPLIIVAASEKHPAQAKTVTEDVVLGLWTTLPLSGALGAPRKKALLTKINKLLNAVKQAREEANMAEIERVHIGAALFDYILS